MTIKRWGWGLLLAFAGLALWLLLGSGRVFGHDLGALGMTLLIGVTWLALHGLSSVPQGEFERGVSPGEWKAWIGLGFMMVAVAYLLSNVDGYANAPSLRASGVVRNLVLLLIAWAVLSQVVAARWKGAVQEDERDREIAAKAVAWGRGALLFHVIALAVLLGFSPVERLQWATHSMLATMLVSALMWGWLAEYAATAVMYVYDRRR